MVNHDKSRSPGFRTALSAALLLAATSASAVTVDGDLSDLIAAVGSAPYNSYTGSDPMGNVGPTVSETNNGFDIKNVYSFYDVAVAGGTLYLGISFFGTVGDSRALGDSAPCENGSTTTCIPGASRSVFDSNESYRFSLFEGTATTDPQLLAYKVTGTGTGESVTTTNPYVLGVSYAVSESYNGIEFKITGLNAQLAPFSFTNPANLAIFFGAGSSDGNPGSLGCTTCTSPYSSPTSGAEDTFLLNTQVVPVPAAIWLFGSGLLGLVGVSARKRRIKSPQCKV